MTLEVGDIIKVVRETCYVPPSDRLLIVTSVSSNDFWQEPGDGIRAQYLVKHKDNSYGEFYVGSKKRPRGLILERNKVRKI